MPPTTSAQTFGSIIQSIDPADYENLFDQPDARPPNPIRIRRVPSGPPVPRRRASPPQSSSTSDTHFDSDYSLPSQGELGYNMPPRGCSTTSTATVRQPRRRTATQAFESEADHEDGIPPTAGPSRKRRNFGDDRNSAAQAASSARAQGEPIVIEDLDDDDSEDAAVNAEVERLKETLQKQREEQVKAQEVADAEPPKLNKLQCVICMDSFTDMTATSCGHIFCHECLISALRASENRRFQATGVQGKRSQCPVCRTNLNRSKNGDLIPLLIMKKGAGTQPRRARVG